MSCSLFSELASELEKQELEVSRHQTINFLMKMIILKCVSFSGIECNFTVRTTFPAT